MFLNKKARAQLFLLAFFACRLCIEPGPALGRMLAGDPSRPPVYGLARIAAVPDLEQCTHKTGRLWFSVTNYGILGNGRNVFLRDCITGGQTSSAEFPGGSGVEYLYQGALWVGGIVGEDTLVSTGTDGWVNIREFFPDAGAAGSIIRRSADRGSPFYSSDAVSDLDFIAVYYDTLTDPRIVTNHDPEDGRPFKPLGLKVEQRSYSWAAEWGQDWVLLDYTITNIGKDPIKKAYAGLFIDPDVGNVNRGTATHLDDYCAFKDSAFLKIADGYYPGIRPEFLACAETLNLAYAFDNDGDPEPGSDFSFSSQCPTGALGVSFLRAREAVHPFVFPTPIAFNWWVADSSGRLDWGPQHLPGRANIYGGLGQPTGDGMRYFYLSNHEIDYDQIYSALNYGSVDPFSAGIWRPPLELPQNAARLAAGADSRFLLSVGPFDLNPGDSLPVTAALMVGAHFHRDPANYATNFASASDFLNLDKIRAYRSSLDLSGLIEDLRMARNVFDNENIQSPVLCRLGMVAIYDSTRLHGDGIPDFKGPIPPPYPKMKCFADEGTVTIRWNGRETENAIDPISGLKDFEGYTVEMSPDGINYTIIGQYDKVNWRVYYLNRDLNGSGTINGYRWDPAPIRPLTYGEIQNYYALRWDTCLNKIGSIQKPIDPGKFNDSIPPRSPLPYIPPINAYCNPDTNHKAIRVRFCDHCGRFNTPVDSIFFFVPVGFNLGLNPIRMYPSVADPNNDSSYWYQYSMTGLFPSQPVWFSVAPFDNGMVTPDLRIEPQQAAPFGGAQMVYPIASDSNRRANALKISVYPNPYRIDNNYSFFEKKQAATGHPQSSKRINFVNLPPRCTIRIYTLDGDLVQQIDHDKDPAASDSGYEFWDLLTRNAQMVAAGLYIFTVESKEGRFIGKMVIIQ